MTRPETTEALARVLWAATVRGANAGEPLLHEEADNLAAVILTAVEAGEVPGLVASDRLALAWDEGYRRGLLDAEQDLQHGADNPYEREGGGGDE